MLSPFPIQGEGWDGDGVTYGTGTAINPIPTQPSP